VRKAEGNELTRWSGEVGASIAVSRRKVYARMYMPICLDLEGVLSFVVSDERCGGEFGRADAAKRLKLEFTRGVTLQNRPWE
jgi:hypothetical protein